MDTWTSDNLRTWIVGTAATGLLWHSLPNLVHAESPASSAKKKPVVKPVAADAPAKALRVVVPATNKSSKNSIQLVSQNVPADGQKSEVQRQLEALYQQDGRDMPDMNFNFQPMVSGALNNANQSTPQGAPGTTNQPWQQPNQPPNQPARQVRPAQGYTQYQPKPQASAYPSQSNYGGQPNPQPAQGYGTPQDPQAGKPRQTVFGFLKKATGSKQTTASSSQPPMPPDFNTMSPANSNMAPTYSSSYGVATQQQQQAPVRYPEPVRLNNQASRPLAPSNPQQASRTVMPATTQSQATGSVQSASSFTASAAPQFQTGPQILPAPQIQSAPQLPLLSQQPSPLPLAPALKAPIVAVPALNDAPTQLPGTQSVGIATVRREKSTAGTVAATPDFPNPFPEGPEADVTSRPAAPPQQLSPAPAKPIALEPAQIKVAEAPKVDVQTAPKVETVISDQREQAVEIENEPDEVEPSQAPENPYAVEGKNFIEQDNQPVDPTAPSLELPGNSESASPKEIISDNDKVQVIPAAIPEEEPATGTIEEEVPVTADEPNPEKLQKIRQRLGMKGLKGFCPVTLRDERELVDAKSEFHFTHRRQKFHFASAEARDKFEANPLRYKPAAFGADVVALSRDKDVLEGTLDFAAWYKGRLFLFSSETNYEIFVKDPAQYATIEEFE